MAFTTYERLLAHFDSLSVPLHPHEVKSIIKKYLDGKRVSCSHVHRKSGYIEAEKLIKSGMSKPDAISALVQRKGFSRQWSTVLVSKAINKRVKEVIEKDHAAMLNTVRITRSVGRVGVMEYD